MKRLFIALLSLVTSAAFGTTLNPIQLLNPAGSTSGQAIVSTGASSTPTWSNVAASSLAAQAANTVVANVTGSSASPTAFSMPSCSASTSALQWTSGTGFVCNAAVVPITTAFGSGSTAVDLFISNTNANGAELKMTGNGGTTPSKTIRAFSGSLQVLNNAGSTAIMGLSDAGNMTTLGSIGPSTTGGVIGTTLADNANAGSYGEYPTPVSATSVALTNNTPTNIVTISLSAGDWDVTGQGLIQGAASTTFSNSLVGISTTSATVGPIGSYTQMAYALGANSGWAMPLPTVRVNVSSTTTVYCVALAVFATSTANSSCYLRARRVR